MSLATSALHPNPYRRADRIRPHRVTHELTCVPFTAAGGTYVLVNAYLVGRSAGPWMLVDTGMPGGAGFLLNAARDRFGARAPRAIVLTHAHFDHVGSARSLADHWGVPIYAHPLDLPYLTGRETLPPYDPTTGGFVAQLSRFFPRSGTDLRPHIRPLPADGSIPGIDGWRWIATPGHTPGHVAIVSDEDRTLIAGDALTTVNQDSMVDVVLVRQQLNGPSTFATYDWPQAEASVRRLAAWEPLTIACGHGEPMRGGHVAGLLYELAERFATIALPRTGRYLSQPIEADERGLRFVPPPVPDYRLGQAALLAVGTGAGLLLAHRWNPRPKSTPTDQ